MYLELTKSSKSAKGYPDVAKIINQTTATKGVSFKNLFEKNSQCTASLKFNTVQSFLRYDDLEA